MNENKRPLENDNSLAGSIVVFVILMVLFVGGLYLVQFLNFTDVWPMAALLVLFTLAFAIPMTFMGSSDSGDEHRK